VKLGDLCSVREEQWAESVYIPPVQAPQLRRDVLSRLTAERPAADGS
jgi:hypothetical protein